MRHSVVTWLMLLAAAPAAAQTPKRAANHAPPAVAKAWTPSRTPDGQPDLQGVWLNNSATPLERPTALAYKSLLTDDELAELKRRADRLFNDGTSDFAAGDAVFLAALADVDHFTNPGATGTVREMIPREFEPRTSLIVDPLDGKIPPLTAEGREHLARTPPPAGGGPRPVSGPEDLSNALRCLTYGVPRLGGNNLSGAGPLGYYEIVQAPGYVVLILEAIHEARIIPLDGRPHLQQSLRQWSGDSSGRWEGNTLVVDTTNFSPKSNFMGSSETLHLVERFTRASADTLDYRITIDDPATWTAPWTALIHLKRTGQAIYEYACHEGNEFTMKGILGAARARDVVRPK